MTQPKNSGASGTSGTGFGIIAHLEMQENNVVLATERVEGVIWDNVESCATCATCATGLRAKLKALSPEGGLPPDPAPALELAITPEVPAEALKPASPSVMASLDRFFASACEHTFEDGAVGLVAPEHRPPSVEVVRCPVTGEEHPRTACTAFGGCPDMGRCKAFRRPRLTRQGAA